MGVGAACSRGPVPGGSQPAGSTLGGVTHPQPTPPRCRNGAPGAWRSDLISGVQPAVVTELSRSPFPPGHSFPFPLPLTTSGSDNTEPPKT